jgi:hypothetical protein
MGEEIRIMATKPEDDEPLELTDEVEAPEEPENEDDAEGREKPEPDDESEETIIGFEDGPEEQPDDNSTIRHLREKLKEKDARVRELERSVPQKKVDVGEKPTFESCGFDEEAYEKEITSWQQRKSEAEAEERKANEANAEVEKEWQQDVASFAEKKAKLASAVPDLDDLQATVESSLDLIQQAVMVKAANDPALLMVALARNPDKLAELAKIKDPIKLASAIARMEGGVRMVTKRKAPPPDRAQSGSAAVVSDSDKQMEKLEAEAERTKDRSKLIAYKAQLKARGK